MTSKNLMMAVTTAEGLFGVGYNLYHEYHKTHVDCLRDSTTWNMYQ